MATTNLGIALPVEAQANKSLTIGNGLDALDKATQGATALVITGATVVTADQFTLGFSLELTGTPGAPFNLTVPSTRRFFRVENGSDADATVKTGGAGSTVVVASSAAAILYSDGLNISEEGGGGGGGPDPNAIHDNVSGEIAAITLKATPVAGDHVLIEDSEATNAKKRVPFSAFGGAGSGALQFQQTINAVASVNVDLPLTTANAVAYEIVFAAKVSTDGDGDMMFLRITDDGFTTVESGPSDYAWNEVRDATATTNTQTDEADTEIQIATNLGTASIEQLCGRIRLSMPHAANFKTAIQIEFQKDSATPSINSESGGGFYMIESDINGIRLFVDPATGAPNITGEFHIFAIVAA